MRSQKLALRLVFQALLLLVLLVGVGAAVGQEGTTITLWHGWTGADNTEMLNQVIAQFNAENGMGITVEATAFGWDDLFSKLVLSAASGEAPDVVMFHNSEVPEYALRGVLRPLDDLLTQVPVNLEGVPQAIIDASYVDGQFYCLPGDLHPLGLYYNVDLVTAAGLDPDNPPATGEEFLAWAEALTVRGADGVATQFGLDIGMTGALPRWLWFALFNQYGGTFLNEDGTSGLDSDANRQALQMLYDLHHTYQVTSMGQTSGDMSAFRAGLAGMRFVGPWEVNSLFRQGMNFRTAPVPQFGERPATWANTHCLALANQMGGDNYLAGMEFIRWFYDNYALPAVSVGIIPVSPAAQADPILTEDARYPYYEPFVESLQFSVLEPIIPQYTSIFSFGKPTPIMTNLEAVMAGDKTAEQAAADMKAGVDEQLAEDLF